MCSWLFYRWFGISEWRLLVGFFEHIWKPASDIIGHDLYMLLVIVVRRSLNWDEFGLWSVDARVIAELVNAVPLFLLCPMFFVFLTFTVRLDQFLGLADLVSHWMLRDFLDIDIDRCVLWFCVSRESSVRKRVTIISITNFVSQATVYER